MAKPLALAVGMLGLLACGANVDAAGDPTARLVFGPGPAKRAVVRALDDAARRLESEACQLVLTDFKDEHGLTLRENLAALERRPVEFLRELWFVDATHEGICSAGQTLAYTVPGGRMVAMCAARFQEISAAVIIHEMLHALGLGENGKNPNTFEITRQVRARCGG